MSELELSLAIYALAAAISLAIAAVIKIVGALAASRARRRARRAAGAPATDGAPQEGAPRERGPPDEAEVAAIAAAIHAMLGKHRIVHLAERSHGAAWAAEGRAAHHASHDVARHGHATPVKPRH